MTEIVEEREVVVVDSEDESSSSTEDQRTMEDRVRALENGRMGHHERLDEMEGKICNIVDGNALRDLDTTRTNNSVNARINARVTGATYRAGLQQLRDEITQLEQVVTENHAIADNELAGLRILQEEDGNAMENLVMDHNNLATRVDQLRHQMDSMDRRMNQMELRLRSRHDDVMTSLGYVELRIDQYISNLNHYFTLMDRDFHDTVTSAPQDFITTNAEFARQPVYYGPIRRRRQQLRITYVPYQRRVNRRLTFDDK